MLIISLALCFAKHKRNEEREREDRIERKGEPDRKEKKEKKNSEHSFSKNHSQIQTLKDAFFLS